VKPPRDKVEMFKAIALIFKGLSIFGGIGYFIWEMLKWRAANG